MQLRAHCLETNGFKYVLHINGEYDPMFFGIVTDFQGWVVYIGEMVV